MNRLLLILICFSLTTIATAQDFVLGTFKDYKVINTHSTETLNKGKLDIRIGHRFGDLKGGWDTFYGFENAQDIMIGGAYGITSRLSVGFHRTKGGGPINKLLNLTLKYKALRQETEGVPITITVIGLSSASTMSSSDDPDALNNFGKFSHRMIYTGQVLIARKFSDNFSFQLIPSYTHRNLVKFDDENGIISLGFATRIQLNKVMGIIADGTFPFSKLRKPSNGYYPAMGIGLEIDTGGHIFQVNFTNATGIMETDYIPNTRSNWGNGEFRLGFTISRLFNL